MLHAKSKLQQIFSLVLVSLDLSHTWLAIVSSSIVTIAHVLSHLCVMHSHMMCTCASSESEKKMEVSVKEAATFRRMLFATSYLPPEIPNYWNIIAMFATMGNSSVSPEMAKLMMENVQVFSNKAFCSDVDLTLELIAMEYGPNKQDLGVPLVPKQNKCMLCGGNSILLK